MIEKLSLYTVSLRFFLFVTKYKITKNNYMIHKNSKKYVLFFPTHYFFIIAKDLEKME